MLAKKATGPRRKSVPDNMDLNVELTDQKGNQSPRRKDKDASTSDLKSRRQSLQLPILNTKRPRLTAQSYKLTRKYEKSVKTDKASEKSKGIKENSNSKKSSRRSSLASSNGDERERNSSSNNDKTTAANIKFDSQTGKWNVESKEKVTNVPRKVDSSKLKLTIEEVTFQEFDKVEDLTGASKKLKKQTGSAEELSLNHNNNGKRLQHGLSSVDLQAKSKTDPGEKREKSSELKPNLKEAKAAAATATLDVSKNLNTSGTVNNDSCVIINGLRNKLLDALKPLCGLKGDSEESSLDKVSKSTEIQNKLETSTEKSIQKGPETSAEKSIQKGPETSAEKNIQKEPETSAEKDIQKEPETSTEQNIQKELETSAEKNIQKDQEPTATNSKPPVAESAANSKPSASNAVVKPAPKKRGRKKKSELLLGQARKTRRSTKEDITPKRTRKLPSRFLTSEEFVALPGAPGAPEAFTKNVKFGSPRSSIEGGRSSSHDETDSGKKKARKFKSATDQGTSKSENLESCNAELLKYSKKQLTPSTMLKKQTSGKKVATPKRDLVTPEILDKRQAEYAVSALYNFRHDGCPSPIEPMVTDVSEPDKVEGGGLQEIKRRRKRRLKKILKPIGGRKWSQERIDRYKNRKKRQKEKGTLAERELKRLGHVFINMTEPSKDLKFEEIATSSGCKNEFCKLGCVCSSLEVPMREEFHCGKAECVFQCLCSHAGASNCLFDSRVQDKTRNLAPEQKEFINTVISKGSENLVVAERGKRERKMPQRLQADFVTGEELDIQGIGKKRHSMKHTDDVPVVIPKKRLLVENWDMNFHMNAGDRQFIVPSPDFLEDRSITDNISYKDLEKEVKTPVKKNSNEENKTSDNSAVVIANNSEEEVTPKIISISSIAPEEFDKVDSGVCSSFGKQDFEVVNEVSVDSPSTFAILQARQKAKQRAMQLLPQFKESIISAHNFKPTIMTNNKFCIVDWSSFTTRFYNGDLFVWVENDEFSKHSIAIITGQKKQPYKNYIPVNEMGLCGLDQSKTYDNLNLKKGAPKCPFILWCNGKYWEILGKLSNSNQLVENSVLQPKPIGGTELPSDTNDAKWIEIPATMKNLFSRLDFTDEKLSISYLSICKLLTIAWRTKQAFVSAIKKASAPHKHAYPFGLYSIPAKSKVFLGPYGRTEQPRVRLVPLPGVNEQVSLTCFVISTIHPQGINNTIAGGQKILPKIAPRPEEIKIDDDNEVECRKGEAGFFTCNQVARDVPVVVFENEECQLRNPMGKKMLLFESISWASKFLSLIFQDLFPLDEVRWTHKIGMPSTSTLKEYFQLRNGKGARISSKELFHHFGHLESTGRPIRKKIKPEKLKDKKKTTLEAALAKCQLFKARLKKGASGQETKQDDKIPKLSAKLDMASSSDGNEVIDLSDPEVVIEETSQSSKDCKDSEQPVEENDDELRDKYRQEIKEAFEIAEGLYPSFGDGRHSRLTILQRMNNEVELLKVQERALKAEMELAMSNKADIFKRFTALDKKQRKSILNAIKEQSATNKDEPIKDPPNPILTKQVDPLESPVKETSLTPAPEIIPLDVSPQPSPTKISTNPVQIKILTKQAPPIKELDKNLPEPTILRNPVVIEKPITSKPTVLNLVSSGVVKGGGEFIRLSAMLPKTISGVAMQNLKAQLPKTMHIPISRLTTPTINRVPIVAKTVVLPGRKSTDTPFSPGNVKASVPWVKCIPSVGTLANDDKIKSTKDNKVPKVLTSAAPAISVDPTTPSLNANKDEEITIYDDDDDLAGMPVLTPAVDTPPLSNDNEESTSNVEKSSFVEQPVSSLTQLQEAGFSGLDPLPPVIPSRTSTSGSSARRRPYAKNYTADTLREALFAVCDNMPVAAASRKFGIPSRTLYSRLNMAKIRVAREEEVSSPDELE